MTKLDAFKLFSSLKLTFLGDEQIIHYHLLEAIDKFRKDPI